jgi:hypothetical protein
MIKQVGLIGLGMALVFSLGLGGAVAQDKNSPAGSPKEKEVVVAMEVSGTVSGLTPNFIAVIYGRNEAEKVSLEMAFSLDKDVRIAHKNSIQEIGLGDEVRITYDEVTRINAEGKIIARKRVAKEVAFVRQAQKVQETGTLVSETEPQEAGQE